MINAADRLIQGVNLYAEQAPRIGRRLELNALLAGGLESAAPCAHSTPPTFKSNYNRPPHLDRRLQRIADRLKMSLPNVKSVISQNTSAPLDDTTIQWEGLTHSGLGAVGIHYTSNLRRLRSDDRSGTDAGPLARRGVGQSLGRASKATGRYFATSEHVFRQAPGRLAGQLAPQCVPRSPLAPVMTSCFMPLDSRITLLQDQVRQPQRERGHVRDQHQRRRSARRRTARWSS